jgi:hypothetical protein
MRSASRAEAEDPDRMQRKCHRYKSGGGGEHMVEMGRRESERLHSFGTATTYRNFSTSSIHARLVVPLPQRLRYDLDRSTAHAWL